MQSFVIEGGYRLSGRVKAAGNKNGALPILAASLLTGEPVELENVPRIRDVNTMIELLQRLGADADWTGPNEVRVHAAELSTYELDEELGRRRIDTHIHAFASLGADIAAGRRYEMRAAGLRGTHLFLGEASVTGTEN